MTRKLNTCYYGGGSSCQRQGGDGSSMHARTYVHPIPSVEELGNPVGDFVEPVSKTVRAVVVPGLEEFFEEDLSKAVLELPLSEIQDPASLVKSFYDFDLTTKEGVEKLLELLPIMDPEILIDIMGEIWLGYVAEDSDPSLMRAEIKGYLMDYLETLA